MNGEEVELKRAIVASAREVVAIIDHSKWGEIALATFCPIERIKMIITDASRRMQWLHRRVPGA